MKKIRTFAIFLVVLCTFSTSHSQILSVGFFSGANLSDIHTSNYSGIWKFKTGPSQGFFVDYAINRIIGIRTGANYSAVYYQYTPYIVERQWLDYSLINSSYLPVYPTGNIMDFSFLTIPAQIRISIPAKPRLNLSAGIFYSFLHDYNISYSGYTDGNASPVRKDFGFIYSAGISYPLTNLLSATFDMMYQTGRKEFLENYDYKHGSMDFILGIAVNVFSKKNNKSLQQKNDTLSEKFYVSYWSGANIAWNSCKYFKEKYSSYTAPSAGIILNFKLTSHFSWQTGISYNRIGYSLKDSSDYFFRFYKGPRAIYSVDSKVKLDYIVIPAILSFNTGKTVNFFFNTGPYLGVKLNARCSGQAYNAIRTGSSYTLEKTVVDDDIEGLIKNNDFGWLLGCGMTVPLYKKYKIDLGLQYRQGLIDVLDKSYFSENKIYLPTESIIRNSSLALQIGIRVPVRKK